MRIVIDGYNLLHAVGWGHQSMTIGQWNAARRRLLDWLAESRALQSPQIQIQIIFDAQQRSKTKPTEELYRGLDVIYATGRTADDWIEEILPTLSRSGQVILVSNDHRLQDAARRSGSQNWSTTAFLDWLERTPAKLPPAPIAISEKPEHQPAAQEFEELYQVFSKPKPKK